MAIRARRHILVMFFGTQTESWPAMNYDRNGTHPSVVRVERQLLALLGLSSDDYGIGVTSSGMSAYTRSRRSCCWTG